ncbi:MAG: NAD(P)-dependent oxidoreductase [Pseudomonadota bacterium]
MRYAFIGLGNLGGHLAASLAGAGYDVAVYDRDADQVARAAATGCGAAGSCAEVVRGADAVITCLPAPSVTEAVLEDILPELSKGATWIEMSTLGREEMQRLAARAAEAGVETLECPVTGGVHLAKSGEITVLVGGDKDLFEKYRPALEIMGGQIFHMGPLGSASIIKVITNMLAFINLVSCGEALMLAKRGGLDLGQAWAAIAASSGNSFVHETEGQLILNGSYDIAFTMDLALKDLGFTMDFSEEFGVPLALASKVKEIFDEGRAAYGGDAQSSQIVKLLEDALDTDLRAPGFPARLE